MSDAPAGSLRVERRERVALVWFERPPLHIFDLAMTRELAGTLESLSTDGDIDVVVLRGAGGKAFSAGVSIQDHVAERIDPMLRAFHDAVRRLDRMPQVTIAAVDGHCLGGGLELATVCDLVIAAERSRFGQPEIRLGCFPPVATALLPRLLGGARASDLVLTGRLLDAEQAERWGLVSRRVADARFDEAVGELLAELAAHSGAVLRRTKQALRAGRDTGFHAALDTAEAIYLDDLVRTRDMHEGIAAFLERRVPQWSHE